MVNWTAEALPSVIAVTSRPARFGNPDFDLPELALRQLLELPTGDHVIQRSGISLRVSLNRPGAGSPTVVLPLDKLFEIRISAAIRLWRALTSKPLGRDPAALSSARRSRLILGLRALDGHQEGATYRDIADGLFGMPGMSARAWKTHDLRDRTIRLVRYGRTLMRGGYRSLLLHPYRRRT